MAGRHPAGQIDWIGNEGTRVSSLLRHLQEQPLTGAQAELRRDLLEKRAPKPFEVATEALGRSNGHALTASNGQRGNGALSSGVQVLPALPPMPLQVTIALTLNVVVAAQRSQARA